MDTSFSSFSEVWLVDFEYGESRDKHPDVRCLVAIEYHTRRTLRLWCDDLGAFPPFDTGEGSLFVAYFASAEMGCFISLGWPRPARILDLFTEFRNLTNGLENIKNSLIDALAYFGLDSIGTAEKTELRELALRGGHYTDPEKIALLDYCQTDVQALGRLLPCMLPTIKSLPEAAFRGRYMASVAAMEHEGIPVDMTLLNKLQEHWPALQDRLIATVDAGYHVYDGRSFRADRFEQWLAIHEISWPRLDAGALDLSKEVFSDMAKICPAVEGLKDLRHSLSQMRLNSLIVGDDGCNRCLLSPFNTRTSRNSPSPSKFIFGAASWLRHLIQPKPGFAINYLDWEQQEFGIAAALSGDKNMLDSYRSGDSYLDFAKKAGALPPEATKKSHPAIRNKYKECCLGVQYGMEAPSLALRINRPEIEARALLLTHRNLYRQFWTWAENYVMQGSLANYQTAGFGWTYHIPPGFHPRVHGERMVGFNPRMLQNFPMQATGAEILRVACCLATENGIRVCAPVHDALLITARIEEIDQASARMEHFMKQASRIVLKGFELRTESNATSYPDHFASDKGKQFWTVLQQLLGEFP